MIDKERISMRQIFTIGRGQHCDIVLIDNTDVVSREHAVLEVDNKGNYYIIDTSRNGTYVNGIKITPNDRVLVTRNDTISFSHACTLDWNKIPHGKMNSKKIIYLSSGILFIILSVLFAVVVVPKMKNRNIIEINGSQMPGLHESYYPTVSDEEIEDVEKKDSLENVKAKDGDKNKVKEKEKNTSKDKAVKKQEKKKEIIDAIY